MFQVISHTENGIPLCIRNWSRKGEAKRNGLKWEEFEGDKERTKISQVVKGL